jgi:hypothetical protein
MRKSEVAFIISEKFIQKVSLIFSPHFLHPLMPELSLKILLTYIFALLFKDLNFLDFFSHKKCCIFLAYNI